MCFSLHSLLDIVCVGMLLISVMTPEVKPTYREVIQPASLSENDKLYQKKTISKLISDSDNGNSNLPEEQFTQFTSLMEQAKTDIEAILPPEEIDAFNSGLEYFGTYLASHLTIQEGETLSLLSPEKRSIPLILISEDEATLANNAAWVLHEGLNANVVITATPPNTLLFAYAFNPDLIISDVSNIGPGKLPGLRLGELLKQIEKTKDISLMYVSARGTELDRQMGLAVGADRYDPKPVNMEDFVSNVLNIIEGRSVNNELVPQT